MRNIAQDSVFIEDLKKCTIPSSRYAGIGVKDPNNRITDFGQKKYVDYWGSIRLCSNGVKHSHRSIHFGGIILWNPDTMLFPWFCSSPVVPV